MPERKFPKGIVLTENSGKVDFEIIKNDFDFVLMRTSYRSLIDQYALIYYEDCKKNNIPVHFFHDTWGHYNEHLNKEITFIKTLPFDFTNSYFCIRYTDEALLKAKSDISYLNEANILNHELTTLVKFINKLEPIISTSNLVFYMRHYMINEPQYNYVKQIMPLWYYRNSKTFDETKCIFWQKRYNDTVPGVQNKAGIVYKTV